MISVLNYGMGNIRSVQNALNYLRIESCVIDSPEQVLESEKLILPGVGWANFGKEHNDRTRIRHGYFGSWVS